MKLVEAKRCSGVFRIAFVAMLILAIVLTSLILVEQDADAQEEKRRVSDQLQEDDRTQEQVMTICLMPLECS